MTVNATLFFDIGNVLLFFSHEKMCRQLADLTAMPYQRVHDILFKEGYGIKYELGKVSTESLHHYLSQTCSRSIDFIKLLKAAGNIFTTNQEMIPIIKDLKSRRHRLILLSNTCKIHYNYAYSHFPILRYFDDRILSYEVQMRKPDKAIYQKALTMAYSTPGFYVDDIPEYVQGARKTGLDAVHYKRSQKLREELCKRGFL